jgi:hypothetical protein
MPSGTFWSAERHAKCVALWKQGYSAYRVGQEIGVTRNSVLGRLHRTGESKRDKPIKTVRLRRYSRVPYQRRQKLTQLILADIPPPPQLNTEHNVGFLDIKPNQCREIVGHGVAMVCGAPVLVLSDKQKSFCAYHANINYGRRAA